MQIELQHTIDQPIDAVWEQLAENFNDIQRWYGPVLKSYELPGAQRLDGAPTAGRICEFTEDPDGLQAHETIVGYDPDARRLDVVVEAVNTPGLIPVRRNKVRFQLREVSPSQTRLEFEAEPELKPHGYLLYPVLKLGLKRNFNDLLVAFKAHNERLVS